MSETKRVSPYTRLKEAAKEFARQVTFPHTRVMWCYPKKNLGATWQLTNLYERVAAAEQIGYDVHLCATAEGLQVVYVKKPPARPWELS